MSPHNCGVLSQGCAGKHARVSQNPHSEGRQAAHGHTVTVTLSPGRLRQALCPESRSRGSSAKPSPSWASS